MTDSGHEGEFRDKMDTPNEFHEYPQGTAPSLRKIKHLFWANQSPWKTQKNQVFVPGLPVSMIPTGKRCLVNDPEQDGGSHVSKSGQAHREQLSAITAN